MDGIDSMANRVSFRTKIVEANEESDVISERVRGATAFIKSVGGHLGSAPYGFMAVRADRPAIEGGSYRARILQQNPEEMAIVAKILYYVNNRTELDDIIELEPRKRFRVGICNVIADKFNADGVRRRDSVLWDAQAVKALYKKFKNDQSITHCDVGDGEHCEICHQTHSQGDNKMVLCDHCGKGFHIKCIRIPQVPVGSFFCGVVCQFAGASMEE